MANAVQVQILGSSFSIQTDEDPAYVGRLVSYVDGKTKQLQRSLASRDPLKIALLTAVIVADELFKERAGPRSSGGSPEDGQAEILAGDIIRRIESALREE